MTKEQVENRIKWLLRDLKENHVIPDDVQLDSRLIAIRSARHVREMNLWPI